MSERVTIVIPHFRAAVLSECLEALFAHTDLPVRVIVVDDGPDAPSIQQAKASFPQIEVLRNEQNVGFCESCNRGLHATETEFAVLLNDDTRVAANWLEPLIETLKADPAVGACQPKLLGAIDEKTFDYAGAAGGYIDRFGFSFCRGRMFDCLEQDSGQYDAAVAIFWACGSALCMRVDPARKIGFLDVDYEAHFEEIDFCWRLQLSGFRILSVPTSVVYHHAGYSLPPSSFRKNYLNHRNNLVMLFKNSTGSTLLWLLPVRLALEAVATLGYLLTGRWKSVAAPTVALWWIFFHPLQLWRRRRHSQGLVAERYLRSDLEDTQILGVYNGSLLYRFYLKGTRTSSALISEESEP